MAWIWRGGGRGDGGGSEVTGRRRKKEGRGKEEGPGAGLCPALVAARDAAQATLEGLAETNSGAWPTWHLVAPHDLARLTKDSRQTIWRDQKG